MEVDSGAGFSVMGSQSFEKLWPISRYRPKLSPYHTQFRDYQKNKIETRGTCIVEVKFRNELEELPLVITEGGTTNLLGRNWFARSGIEVTIKRLGHP